MSIKSSYLHLISRVTHGLLFVPDPKKLARVVITMGTDNILVVVLGIVFFVEVKLLAVKGLDVDLFGDQTQVYVVELEVLGVHAAEVHVYQGLPGQYVGSGGHVGRPQVVGILLQGHVPL